LIVAGIARRITTAAAEHPPWSCASHRSAKPGKPPCSRRQNTSRAGDTEAHSLSIDGHCARCRGGHQGVRRGRRRCVPALPPRRTNSGQTPCTAKHGE
jgi:hypothetical protein